MYLDINIKYINILLTMMNILLQNNNNNIILINKIKYKFLLFINNN